MPGPAWDVDDPGDALRIQANATTLTAALKAAALGRAPSQLTDILDWHRTLYLGCRVPVAGYVGALRGDTSVPDLIGYEVGLGPLSPDSLPEKVAVWSPGVAAQVNTLVTSLNRALSILDTKFAVGQRPSTTADIHELLTLAAELHGEWLRIHPFANGNGRIARTLVTWLMLRYGMPPFLTVKPRPPDAAYLRAGRASMGRPPDFRGDHQVATNVFVHMFSQMLQP